MINLLSTDRKIELRAARVNVFLLRYTGILVLALIFILGVLFVSYRVLQQTEATANERIASNDTKAGVFSATKAEVNALSGKLNEAKQQLSQEISYATLLTTLGNAMPAGTILESLKINNQTLDSNMPVDLTAYAKTDENAAAIQKQLQASPLFSQVSLKGTQSNSGISGYPIKANFSVIFNKRSL